MIAAGLSGKVIESIQAVRKARFTKLSQPGGLKATEGRTITSKKGKVGAPSHALEEHGPDVEPAYVKQRVENGKPTAIKFTVLAKMETAISNTIDTKQAEIDAWLQTNPPAGVNKAFSSSPKLGNLGEGYYRTPAGTVEKIPGNLENVTIVLKSDGKGNYIIQTDFPTNN